MPKIAYQKINFREASLSLISYINEVISDYADQGYSLTVRQIYYQLVARDIIPNNERSYKNTAKLLNDARLAGYIDWNAVEDRTRNLSRLSHWDCPEDIIDSSAKQYHRNWWEDQSYYVEVWVEKDALVQVVGMAAEKYDVSYFSCRGYTSQSEMWVAAQRLRRMQNIGKYIAIIHLGDHDPSGIDMSRDITDRLSLFGVDDGATFFFHRIALNYDQIGQYSPPPNPAKMTDSRFNSYVDKYGRSSWELDALDPAVLDTLISLKISEYIDKDRFEAAKNRETSEKRILSRISERYADVIEML